MRDRAPKLRTTGRLLAALALAGLIGSCSSDGGSLTKVPVSGTLRLRGGAPIPGATIVFLQETPPSGGVMPLAPRARKAVIYPNPPVAITDAGGRYSIEIFSGRYDVWVGGGPDSGFMSQHMATITVRAPRVPLDLSYEGYRVSGKMIHLNVALASGSIFVEGPTNTARATLHNSGYSMLLPGGAYDIWANPNEGYWGVPRVKFEGVTVSSDTTIDWHVDGHFVQGTVRTTGGSVVYGAVVAATSPNASAWNYTDSNGFYGLHLPTGAYRFIVTPPPGADTLGGVATGDSVPIDAPQTLDFTLPPPIPPQGP
jgi:hypothetical protein